jgi:hypothetical protein
MDLILASAYWQEVSLVVKVWAKNESLPAQELNPTGTDRHPTLDKRHCETIFSEHALRYEPLWGPERERQAQRLQLRRHYSNQAGQVSPLYSW